MSTPPLSARSCAEGFARGEYLAREIAEATLSRIQTANPLLKAYTAITTERALAEADALDAARRRGDPTGPLAAVPYAVKNLFDVAGLTTLAGSRHLAGNPPATRDAQLVERLAKAGAMLTGTLNMDALAYGFTTENTFYGVTRNPLDPTRVAGGSSGGSAAAVAAGLVPLALASDTNGSIRVPASLCGLFGLKPTYGRLPRCGSFPFVDSLDHLGPLASCVEDLALVYDLLQGPDPADHACAQRPAEPTLSQLIQGAQGLRVARLGGYFDDHAGPEARLAAKTAAAQLGATATVELPQVTAARAAAFIITAAEGGARHLEALKRCPDDFEPLSRDRLLAGALVPAAWTLHAQRVRQWFREEALKLFQSFDLLVAPATPVTAPLVGQAAFELNGQSFPTRANLGLLTQPLSFIGLPVAVAPLWPRGVLPMGVQLIAPPWREDLCLRAAWTLEQCGSARTQIGLQVP